MLAPQRQHWVRRSKTSVALPLLLRTPVLQLLKDPHPESDLALLQPMQSRRLALKQTALPRQQSRRSNTIHHVNMLLTAKQ
jgi:hypothetical protein